MKFSVGATHCLECINGTHRHNDDHPELGVMESCASCSPGQQANADLDGCEAWSLESSFEFDPDDVPEVRSFALLLSGATSEAFQCQISVDQDDVCGPGYYRIGSGQSGSSELVTLDCSGVSDDFEGTLDMVGYLLLTGVDTGELESEHDVVVVAGDVKGHVCRCGRGLEGRSGVPEDVAKPAKHGV